jgi:hypothetical protein
MAMGIARSTLDAFRGWCVTRYSSAANPASRENKIVQAQVAPAEARLSAARAYLLGSLEEITGEVERNGQVTLEQRILIRLASTFAIH